LFQGFDPARVARLTSRDVRRLTNDSSIIRNRRKIEAIIENANVFLRIKREHRTYRRWLDALPAESPRQVAALYPLFRQTFRFMGPETTKCYLMGVGKIAPWHEKGCWCANGRA
jgi:DNA-3-methyladenine glycosylase I